MRTYLRLMEWLRRIDGRLLQRECRHPNSGLTRIDVWRSSLLASLGLPSALVLLWGVRGHFVDYFRARIRADGTIVEC
jgi:hypothetical protein